MATALQALERMLLSQERREQAKVQESLAMMQLAQTAAYQQSSLAQQKSYQDRQLAIAEEKQNIAVMGSNLELLTKYNDTMQLRSAGNFLQVAGLSSLFSEFKDDEDGMTNAVKRLTGKDEGFAGIADIEGIDKQIASDLVSATWLAYEEKDPRAIINIASKLHYIDESNVFLDSYDKKLFQSFQSMGILTDENRNSMLKQFKTMRKTLDNEMKLSEELDEFTRKGPKQYTIDREFDLIDESLKKLDLTKPPEPPLPPSNITTVLPPDKVIERFSGEVKTLKEERKDIKDAIKSLNDLENDVEFSRSLGLDIPENDIKILKNKEKVLNELNASLDALEEKIKTTKEAKTRAKNLLMEQRWDEVSGGSGEEGAWQQAGFGP